MQENCHGIQRLVAVETGGVIGPLDQRWHGSSSRSLLEVESWLITGPGVVLDDVFRRAVHGEQLMLLAWKAGLTVREEIG